MLEQDIYMKERNEINGYVVIYDPTHKKAMSNKNWKGWIYEHISVAEENMGRSLLDDEVVHHLDFNRRNNKPTNLLVLTKGMHNRLHKWINKGFPIDRDGDKIVLRCVVCGKPLVFKQKKTCSRECYYIDKKNNCKTFNLNKGEIEEKLKYRSVDSVAKDYNISGNGLKKWLIKEESRDA